DELPRSEVPPVATHAHAVAGAAGQDRPDVDLFDPGLLDRRGRRLVDHLVFVDDDLPGLRMIHGLRRHAPGDALAQRLDDLLDAAGDLLDRPDLDTCRDAAVLLAHDDILGDIHQAAREVPGVRRAERRVGQALAGAVRRREVLEHGESLAEVRLDRDL